MTLPPSTRRVNGSDRTANQFALRFALLRKPAHNPLMRYGLGELKGGEPSALRDLVNRYMVRGEWTKAGLHRASGISPTTLAAIGTPGKKDSDKVLATLAEYLNIPIADLKRARATDEATRNNPEGWSATIYRLAAVAAQKTASDQRRLLRIARVIDADDDFD